MILTKPQQQRFWRDWSAVKTSLRAEGWNDIQIETERHAAIERAGFDSLTQVDRSGGFDRLLAELGRLREDVSRTAELTPAASDRGDRRRYLYLIRQHAAQLGGPPYVLALARDKFHTTTGLTTVDDLTTRQLYQLMITLNARRRSKTKSDQNASLTSSEPSHDQVQFQPAETAALPRLKKLPGLSAFDPTVISISAIPVPEQKALEAGVKKLTDGRTQLEFCLEYGLAKAPQGSGADCPF